MAIYHVKTTGSDSADGSDSTPWLTPARGVLGLSLGDTLDIHNGIYTGSGSKITTDTTTGIPRFATIRAHPGDTVTIRPPHNVGCVHIDGEQSPFQPEDITIEGIIFDGINTYNASPYNPYSPSLAFIARGARRITCRDCEWKNSMNTALALGGSGPFSPSGGGTISIIGGSLHDVGLLNTPARGAYGAYPSGPDITFDGVHIYNCNSFGLHYYNNADAGLRPVMRPIIRNCRIHDTCLVSTGDAAIVVGWGSDGQIYNNLIYRNGYGLWVYVNSGNHGVYHNTFYDNNHAGVYIQYPETHSFYKNNILYLNLTPFEDLAGTPAGNFSNNLTTDPGFKNAGADDFSLASPSSAAVNFGTPIASVTTDIVGVSRPQGAAPDAGAYEFPMGAAANDEGVLSSVGTSSASFGGGSNGQTAGVLNAAGVASGGLFGSMFQGSDASGGGTFTKLYLTTGTPIFTPATIRGAWDDTGGATTRALDTQKTTGGDIALSSRSEVSASATWDVLLYRGISGPLGAQSFNGISVDTFIAVSESFADANMVWHLHIYLTQGNTDTVRATLLSDYIDSVEWPITDNEAGLQLASAQALANVSSVVGDRMVVELGYQAQNTTTVSRFGRLWYGTKVLGVPAADMTAGGPATLAAFLSFSSAILEEPIVLRSTQDLYEATVDRSPVNLRDSQSFVEVIVPVDKTTVGADMLDTQSFLEVIVSLNPALTPAARVSQSAIEVLVSDEVANVPPGSIGGEARESTLIEMCFGGSYRDFHRT